MMDEFCHQIEEAYRQCEAEILGVQPKEVEIRLIRNHIVIMVKGSSAIERLIHPASIRGRTITNALCDVEREQFQSLLKQKLTDLVGCHVTSIQSDICVDTDEKLELIHLSVYPNALIMD